MRLENQFTCCPDGWTRELIPYMDPSYPLPANSIIICGNIHDLLFCGCENGSLYLTEYITKILDNYDNILEFDMFHKISRVKGKDKKVKEEKKNKFSGLKEKALQLNESRGSNIQSFKTMDSYMRDSAKNSLVIIKDFDTLVVGNQSPETKDITAAVKGWYEIQNIKNLSILLTGDVNALPEVLKTIPKVRIPFPTDTDYFSFIKGTYQELAIQYNRNIEFIGRPLEIIQQFSKYTMSFKEVRYILCKAFQENIKLDKASIRKLIFGGEGLVKSFDDLTEEDVVSLYDRLSQMVIGQDEAVKAICQAIKIYAIGLKDKNKPIANLFFAGPTGVGKTRLAKCLATICLGSEQYNMIRLDMSEYQERHNASDFVGAPPGYVGYESGSHFINRVLEMKEGIILLDEIEKAHPDVLNILLQVLDDGRITDKKSGRVINLKNFIFIMTSNIGQKESMNEKDKQRKKEITLQCLKNTFRPELVNRFDEIVVFNPLDREDCLKIAQIELNETINSIKTRCGVTIEFDHEAVEFIVQQGFDPVFNGRPLKRTIEKYVKDPFSDMVLNHEVKQGDRFRLSVSENKEMLTFKKIQGS